MHNWKYITHVKHRGSLPNSPRQTHHFPVPTNPVNANASSRYSLASQTFLHFMRIFRKVPDLASDENLGNAKPIGVKHLLFRHFEKKVYKVDAENLYIYKISWDRLWMTKKCNQKLSLSPAVPWRSLWKLYPHLINNIQSKLSPGGTKQEVEKTPKFTRPNFFS